MLARTGRVSRSAAYLNRPRMNCKKNGKGQRRLKAQGSTKSHCDCSLMNLQEEAREASKRTEHALQGPPVDFSGKDKLPGASIHLEQPLGGPEDTSRILIPEGKRGRPPHPCRQTVVGLGCVSPTKKCRRCCSIQKRKFASQQAARDT